MKKIFYTLGLALLMVGCSDEDFTNWKAPQSVPANAEEAAKTVKVTVTPGEAVDFATVTADSVQLFTPAVSSDMAIAEQTIVMDVYNADSTEQVRLSLDNDGKVATADLRSAVEKLFGRRPVQREVNATIIVNTLLANNMSIVNQAPYTFMATPVAPVIAEHYYYVGAANGWSDSDKTYELSNGGGDVYDNPVFTGIVPAPYNADGTRADNWFKIAPENAYTSGDFWKYLVGVENNGDQSLTGGLVVGDGTFEAGAFCQPGSDGAKFYKISINMLDQRYEIVPMAFDEFCFLPGNGNGWSPEAAPALRSPNYDGVYEGFAYLDGDFKFTKYRDWSAEWNFNDFTTYSDGFTQGGGTNINCATTGYYKVKADVPNQTFEATLTTWSVIGGVLADDWTVDGDMTFDPADESWTVTADFKAGEYKFRANKDWGINMGGTLDNLSQDGSNLRLDADGNYTIKLYLSRKTSSNCYATVTKN
jgi:hypothetical protein